LIGYEFANKSGDYGAKRILNADKVVSDCSQNGRNIRSSAKGEACPRVRKGLHSGHPVRTNIWGFRWLGLRSWDYL